MSLFISNIDYDASEEDIASLLNSHGVRASSVKLLRERSSGRSKGMAIAYLENPGDLDSIIKRLQGLRLNRREIFVKRNERSNRAEENAPKRATANQAQQRPGNRATPQPTNRPREQRSHQVIEAPNNSKRLAWEDVPMEYRAQVEERCQRQYFKAKVRRMGGINTAVNHWLNEWTVAADSQFPFNEKYLKTIELEINWRLIANSGLDEGMIRPVIAAGGWPIIPGSSIKGLCRKACRNAGVESSQLQRWFGSTEQAGMIRFHGAWPTDSSWKNGLLDLTHPQQDWQLGKGNSKHSANVLVSLYKPRLSIALSSRDSELDPDEWKAIENLLRNALMLGIGGRTSAGYGISINPSSNPVFSCCIEGRFPTPQLLDRKPEFRPTMFRAAIRDMALRLFAGLTSEKMANSAVDQLFGTLQSAHDRKPKVGLLAVRFHVLDGSHSTEIVNGHEATTIAGSLEWIATHQLIAEETHNLQGLLAGVHGLVMSLGGFGRSWRRPDHKFFYQVQQRYDKLIGCHWQWRKSNDLHPWIDVSSPDDLQALLTKTRACARQWLHSTKHLQNGPLPNWREVIHPDRVLIWCRSAVNSKDARAIHWFHRRPSAGHQQWRNADTQPALFRTDLAGRVVNSEIDNQQTLVGSIWNRMLPINDDTHGHNAQPEFCLHTGSFLEIFMVFKHPRNQSTDGFLNLCSYINSSHSSFSPINFD
jgi:CRISPR-associated protein Cmr6